MSSERENQSHLMCPEDTDPMKPPKIISMSAAQIAMIVTISAPTIIPRLRRISGVVTNQSRYLLGMQVVRTWIASRDAHPATSSALLSVPSS